MNGISRYNLRSIDAPTPITGKKRTEINSLQINIFKGDSSSKKLKKEEKWGSKHANLLLMEEGLDLPGVIVPHPWGISSQAVAALLNKHGGIQTAWSALNRLYLQKSPQRFLGRPDVKAHLDAIARAIAAAFNEPDLAELAGPDFTAWLSACRGFLMVRSTGAEDNRRTANAGGNISRAYVSPTPEAFCAAACDVITSYFQTASLQNQINAGINPFEARPQLSVTAQELIGETDDEIPISLVLFTNEPLYVNNENFRIMRISAAYGHGEGVVNGAGVATDTLLIASAPDSEGLYTLYDNAEKGQRLASNGLVDNPPELQKKRALDDSMIARLHELGLAVEKLFGNVPTDMEIVIKGDKIYPVQARPINRIHFLPTYLNMKKLPKGAVTKTVRGEILVPGAVVVAKAHELLFSLTLAQAEKAYDRALHKAVIVSHPEPANSHPIVNFSSLGVPCLLVKEKFDLEGMAVLCMQEGTINLWDPAKGDVKEFISQGFTVHPAKIALSFSNQISARTYKRKMGVPEEVKELLLLLRSDKTQKVALQKLRSHPFVTSLTEEREKLKRLAQYRQVVETVNALDELIQRIDRSFQEIQKSFKSETRLLFHCKVLSTLLLDSRISIAPHIADAHELTPCHPDLYLAGNAAFEISTRDKWRAMLQGLDPAKAPRLKSAIRTLDECGILSAWFAFYFKEGELDISPQDEERMKQFQNLKSQVKALLSDIALFAHPSTWERGNQRLQEIVNATIRYESPVNLTKLFKNGSPITKLAALKVIEEIVQLYDLSIKQMKGSSAWPPYRKRCMFKRMIGDYFTLLELWCQQSGAWKKQTERQMTFRNYLCEIKKPFHKINPLTDKLTPSWDFSVTAAAMDATSDLSRHMPSTLEDYFTLTHQNLLALVSLLTPCAIEGSALPNALLKNLKQIEESKILTYRRQRVGMTVSPDQIEVKYNIPLRNHSAQMVLRYDHESGESTIQILFLGEGRSRWDEIAGHAKVLDHYGILTLDAPVHLNSQEVIVTWKVGSDLPRIMQVINQFCDVSFSFSIKFDHVAENDVPINLNIWSCTNFEKAEKLVLKKSVAVCEYAARGIVDHDRYIRTAALDLFSKLLAHEQGISHAAIAILEAIKTRDPYIRAAGCALAEKLVEKGEALEEVFTVAITLKSEKLLQKLLDLNYKVAELAEAFQGEKLSLKVLKKFITLGYAYDKAFKASKAQSLSREFLVELVEKGQKIEEALSIVRPFEDFRSSDIGLVAALVKQGKMVAETLKLAEEERSPDLFTLLVKHGYAYREAICAAAREIKKGDFEWFKVLAQMVEKGECFPEVLGAIAELFEGPNRHALIHVVQKIVDKGAGYEEAIALAKKAVNSRDTKLFEAGVELFSTLFAQGQGFQAALVLAAQAKHNNRKQSIIKLLSDWDHPLDSLNLSQSKFDDGALVHTLLSKGILEPFIPDRPYDQWHHNILCCLLDRGVGMEAIDPLLAIEFGSGIEQLVKQAKEDFHLRKECLSTLLQQGLYDQAHALAKEWIAINPNLFLPMIREKQLIPEAIKYVFSRQEICEIKLSLLEALFSIGEGFNRALSLLPPDKNNVQWRNYPLVLLLVKYGHVLDYGAFVFEKGGKSLNNHNSLSSLCKQCFNASPLDCFTLLTSLVNHGFAFEPAVRFLIASYHNPYSYRKEEEKLESALLKNGPAFYRFVPFLLPFADMSKCAHLLGQIFALGGGIEDACDYAEMKYNTNQSFSIIIYQLLFKNNQGFSSALQFAVKHFKQKGCRKLFQLLFNYGKGFEEGIKAAVEGLSGSQKEGALYLFMLLAEEGQGWNQALEAVKKGLRSRKLRDEAFSLLGFLVKQGVGYREAIACLDENTTPIELALELKWKGQAIEKAEAFIVDKKHN